MRDNSLARPYAKAAFNFAVKSGHVKAWLDCLSRLAALAADQRVRSLIKNPKVGSVSIQALFKDIAGIRDDRHLNNFLHLLVYYNRLLALPAIYQLFKAYCIAREEQVVATVVSARRLTEAQQFLLQQSLAKRFGKQVILECQEDPRLIGGALIRVGDTVIDGSVQGQLHRLTQHLEMREKICQ